MHDFGNYVSYWSCTRSKWNENYQSIQITANWTNWGSFFYKNYSSVKLVENVVHYLILEKKVNDRFVVKLVIFYLLSHHKPSKKIAGLNRYLTYARKIL